eukprot:PhM_4_TR310/c0_g1_i1/m.64419
MTTDYTSYSPSLYSSHSSIVPSPMTPSMDPSVCMCPDCEYYRCWGMPPTAAPNMSAPSTMPPSPTIPPQSGVMMPRKYSHNPYAPMAAPSTPPVVTANDAIASIVPNVGEYDVYSAGSSMYSTGSQQQMMHMSMAMTHPQHHGHHQMSAQHHHHHQQHQHHQQQHQQANNGGYTLQEQFATAVGAMCDLACTPRGR